MSDVIPFKADQKLMASLRYNEKGLIPGIVQHADSGEILMMAWLNRESLKKTLETGKAVFYSRSRQMLWAKGETSGNMLEVKLILTDCDQDTLVIKALPRGPACHTGERTCFYRMLAE